LKAAQANVQSAIAWKEGLFDFQDAGIPAVMRQLARWYDVEIQYEGAIPERHFTGEMEQGLTAAQVLRLLSYTNVHFRIEGKKIVVTP
jgi:ferric-dicitrate binding protein FerR (iron transport regulator)